MGAIKKFYNQTSNGILYNATVNYEMEIRPLKYEMPSNENDTFKISGQLSSVFLEGYLRDFNHYIVTEKIKLDIVFEKTAQKEVIVDYPNFDQNKIKLLVGDYRYKPNEETQIKKEIESQSKAGFREFVAEDNKSREKSNQPFIRGLNKEDHYYFISTIPSTNYTLSNVTIYGLWNLRSISINESNLAAYPELGMGTVRGFIVQNFPSTSEELSFKADNIYKSLNQNSAKVNVKFEGYSVVNSKQNATLADDQSKFIIKEIEPAFAASLESAKKKPKQ